MNAATEPAARPAHVVLLRGINLGSHNRIAMPALREGLAGAGFTDVRTYLQSGNVVLRTELAPAELAMECERLMAERFGLAITVLTRTAQEVAAIVGLDPLGGHVSDPKRYQVTFLSGELDAETVKTLQADADAAGELVHVAGREVYAWHPAGVARSKVWNRLAGRALGVAATSRNWTTVQNLLTMTATAP